jgi:hypothetical protein
VEDCLEEFDEIGGSVVGLPPWLSTIPFKLGIGPPLAIPNPDAIPLPYAASNPSFSFSNPVLLLGEVGLDGPSPPIRGLRVAEALTLTLLSDWEEPSELINGSRE